MKINLQPFSKSGPRTTAGARPAFTLFELLTVLVILALLLGLTIPVMGRARKTARLVNNQTLMREVAVACQQFRLDNADQSPSYFTARELGSQANLNRGFSPMQSLLLNLMGGIAPSDSTDASVLLNIGPADRFVRVDPSRLRAGESSLRPGKTGYLNLSGNNLKTMAVGDADEYPASGGLKVDPAIAGSPVFAVHSQIPELIDDFGNPILAWVEDERIRAEDTLVPYASNSSNDEKARFYYASNQMYLGALGNSKSALYPSVNLDRRLAALGAVTGSPAFPASNTLVGLFTMPRASRSSIVLHSAGPDGVWLATAAAVQFPAGSGGIDPMTDFDDIVVGVGN